MMLRRFAFLTLGWMTTIACASASAETQSISPAASAPEDRTGLARVSETGVLRVGLSGNQPPFNMKDRDGKLMGIDVDVASTLALAMGVETEFVERPFKDLIPALERGEVDIIISGMTITPRRNMKVAFVGPYQLAGKSILTTSEKLSESSTFRDLDQPEMKVGVLAGSTSEAFAQEFFPRAQLTSVDDYDEAVQMILDRKLSVFIADRPILVVTMLENPNAGLLISNVPLTLEPIGMAIPPDDALFLNFLQNTLQAMEAAGLLEDIGRRWTSDARWLRRMN
jgi:polar amino acid transport system substrate-binding protein